ncbi:MAG: type I-C CRISPR-associated protein Cas8c/Csd1 [Lentisphaerota bacterium]
MILQALKDYYDRKTDLPRQGFEKKEIPYILVLDSAGKPIALNETYEGTGKQRKAKPYIVPQAVKRASNIAANLLWDNPEYALGIPIKGSPERVQEQHQKFKERIDELGDIDDAGLKVIKLFLQVSDKKALLENFGEAYKNLLEDKNGNLSFQLAGEAELILENQKIRNAIESMLFDEDSIKQICLVSGEDEVIERLHSSIKGVAGAQSSGANIISFNLDAFRSYGKEQGGNSPVGKRAAFAYTTALNHLLSKDSTQKMLVGDATTVFWASKETNLENEWSFFFRDPPKDDPDRGTRAVESLFNSIKTGALSTEAQNRFYVLGLAPNASRISIRFWIVNTVAGMAEKIAQHFEDIRIVHGPKESDFLSLFRLLVSTASQGKSENIPPNLAGDTIRSILEGLPYPETLLQALVRRNRAEQSKKDKNGRAEPNVTYPRAAFIKACINRKIRFYNQNIKEELKMSLDSTNTNIGYRLGRLFAALEKIQEEASPGINATIRDRFYGAASGTPVTVFPNLMRLKNHHLAKLESQGRRINFERLIGEIASAGIDGNTGFPATLAIADQGKFAIGYYHQRQDFFTKIN